MFLYHPLYEPLGLAIRASTEGENNLNAMSITFVYTVLLMIIMGFTMWLVYGRGGARGRSRTRKPRFGSAKPERRRFMLKWALIFLVISLIAGAFGFTGLARGAATIAKILFAIFLILFVLFLILALTAVNIIA